MHDIPEDEIARRTWYNDAFFSVPRPPDWQQFLFSSFEIDGERYEIFLHLNRNEVNPVDTAYLTCFGRRYPILPVEQILTDVANRLQEQKNNVAP